MVTYTVGQVPVERIFGLRKAVLRPYLGPDDEYVLPDDFAPTTVAFAARTDDDVVVSVARLTPEPPPFERERAQGWRLRAMATAPSVRNQGVGGAVLDAVIAYIAAQGGGTLWCNARVAAKGLYARAGLETWGEEWEEPEIGPHVVMWRTVRP